MNRFKMRFLFLSLLISLPNSVFAAKAMYLKDLQLIEWAQETDQAGVYKIYGKFNGDYSPRIVKKEDLSFSAKKPVDGVHFGWALYFDQQSQKFEHCYVDNIFENGFTFSFCDLMQNDRQIRKYHQVFAKDMVGQVDSIGSLQKNERARLNADVDGYKKGDLVKIKALFANNMALVLHESLGSVMMGGPYYNAVSKVISVEHLEDVTGTSAAVENKAEPAQQVEESEQGE